MERDPERAVERGDRIRQFVGTEGHQEYQSILFDRLMFLFNIFTRAQSQEEAWKASVQGAEVWSMIGVADEADLFGREVRKRLEEAYAETQRQAQAAAEATAAGRRLANIRKVASRGE